jgi:CspA family cold shock protein
MAWAIPPLQLQAEPVHPENPGEDKVGHGSQDQLRPAIARAGRADLQNSPRWPIFVGARSQRTVFGALRLPLPSHGFPARRAPIPGPPPERKNIMPIGKVKFFNVDKGYGFIQPEDGGNDAFVHISAVQAAGMNSLVQDQRVSYELQNDQRGKTSAVNLQNA